VKLPEFLTQDADGCIRLNGHRIGLETIVFRQREGCSASEIAKEYPTLRADLIHQVIQFYLENRSELDLYVDKVAAELASQEQATPPGPSFEELKARMRLLATNREV
jgi:uncharacterized protein (DUF433 family)